MGDAQISTGNLNLSRKEQILRRTAKLRRSSRKVAHTRFGQTHSLLCIYFSLTAFQIVNVKSGTACELSDDDKVCFRSQSCYTTYLLYHFHPTVRCSKHRSLYGLIHGASERLVVGWRNIPQRDAQNVGSRSDRLRVIL
jgi:hypothetical protein